LAWLWRHRRAGIAKKKYAEGREQLRDEGLRALEEEAFRC
jgi:hypothetical protein